MCDLSVQWGQFTSLSLIFSVCKLEILAPLSYTLNPRLVYSATYSIVTGMSGAETV